MKFRFLDCITDYTPNVGISALHAPSFEELLAARSIGSFQSPSTFLLALVQEAAGFFYAAESDFRFWSEIVEFENVKLTTPPPGEAWQIKLTRESSNQMNSSGNVSGQIKFKKVELALLYDPGERSALFHALQRM